MKDKEYYISKFNNKWKNCLKEAEEDIEKDSSCKFANDVISYAATEIFEETANAEEIVGYYIVYHKDSALRDWLDNTKGINFSEQDKEVDRILKILYVY